QRGQTDRRLHVIREVEECSAEGAQPAKGQAAHRCTHAVFAHAVGNIATSVVARLIKTGAREIQIRFVGFSEVRRAAYEPRNIFGDGVDRFSRTLARAHAFGVSRESWQVTIPALRELPLLDQLKLLCLFRELRCVAAPELDPGAMGVCTTFADAILEI